MVGALRQVVQHPNRSANLHRRRRDGVVKQLSVNDLRAGKGEQDASRRDFFDCFHVQALVALHGIVAFFEALGVGGRVNDHDLVAGFGIFQKTQNVVGKTLVLAGKRRIERDVFRRQFHRFG